MRAWMLVVLVVFGIVLALASACAVDERPASLAGTDVDGELVVDARGRFVPTRGAIRMFDHFLSTLGETDLAGVRELVGREAERRAPEAADEVLALFDRYVAYLASLEAMPPRGSIRDHLDDVIELQRRRFGAETAERLFGVDDAIAIAVLEGDERGLPDHLRAARERMRAPSVVRAQVEAARRAGAREGEIRAIRAARFGEAAADRLADLDRRRSSR
jgi:lipase chaperone LimK